MLDDCTGCSVILVASTEVGSPVVEASRILKTVAVTVALVKNWNRRS